MSATNSTLHILCGKVAAGKSALAARLTRQPATVLLAEDTWLDVLFADQMTSIPDYVRCSSKLRQAMQPHIASLLQAGVSVVLDFPANTVETRKWLLDIVSTTKVDHQLHFLDASDDLCLARLRQRNAQGDHPFAVTEQQFRQITKHFEPPLPEEGFHIVRHEVQA